jgi:hypothetical protein
MPESYMMAAARGDYDSFAQTLLNGMQHYADLVMPVIRDASPDDYVMLAVVLEQLSKTMLASVGDRAALASYLRDMFSPLAVAVRRHRKEESDA